MTLFCSRVHASVSHSGIPAVNGTRVDLYSLPSRGLILVPLEQKYHVTSNRCSITNALEPHQCIQKQYIMHICDVF